MFKRVEKRRRRQEKEEEMGLDSDMKEMLGLHDTDSDESESSSDEKSDASGSEAGGSSPAEEEAAVQDAGEEEEEEIAGVEDEDSEDDEDDEIELPPMSVTEAVRDPVYVVSLDPELKACILCPGKELKNPTMADVHKSSKAHNRRFTRFVELVQKAGPDAEIIDLIRAMNSKPEEKTSDIVPSKRAEKRKEKLASIKAKRAKRKEKLKKANEAKKRDEEAVEARKEAQAGGSGGKPKAHTTESSDEPPSKKRKVDKPHAPPKDTKTRSKTDTLKEQDASKAEEDASQERKDHNVVKRGKVAEKVAAQDTTPTAKSSKETGDRVKPKRRKKAKKRVGSYTNDIVVDGDKTTLCSFGYLHFATRSLFHDFTRRVILVILMRRRSPWN
ncbi:hypothetical protein NM688_g2899 [Phlebia brevispora]|uniref:Uncharacterized protein n=1 Tax=Phlebia brevispora TaxID=194682 RepID=A0ACC1T7Z4_9APHY|nr:hypothetical protein NM688_g2899 [Phlebia brevispora]